LRLGGKTIALDRTGFSDVSFRGEYPIGRVEYRDPAMPLAVNLEAFSPFIPLNTDDSSLPATVMRFAVTNIGSEKVEAELSGWLENAVCLQSGASGPVVRRNRIARRKGLLRLDCLAETAPAQTERPTIVFADFDGDSYGDWKVEGDAFGQAPASGPLGKTQRLSGYQGMGLALILEVPPPKCGACGTVYMPAVYLHDSGLLPLRPRGRIHHAHSRIPTPKPTKRFVCAPAVVDCGSPMPLLRARWPGQKRQRTGALQNLAE